MRAYTGDISPTLTKPSAKVSLTSTSHVDTSTVPIAQLEEMELAARAYAAKQAKENLASADIDIGEDLDNLITARNKKQARKKSARDGVSASAEKNAVDDAVDNAVNNNSSAPVNPLLPLLAIGILVVTAIGLVVTLIVR
ncbi:MAG: hypothetical protein HC782_00560 [Gammaproteobacteria bacterium]|nr:hypothetical protein [Gammaproteobacteria bacterium]